MLFIKLELKNVVNFAVADCIYLFLLHPGRAWKDSADQSVQDPRDADPVADGGVAS